ncbi:hypothetical protein [Edaphobacter modestus]|uniref:Uncharacterized protein n=1 Tax=Edaphobacter modestus TaxID=388466 RepID=A0A4Q7XYM7_9BACT|nr:hypothetical protein [Edaphobacter modestus]RZU29054.1 hypothetical protein BDD14_6648 [Edaphobacter modestus]
MSHLSFQQICDLEPRVQALFDEAKAVHDDPAAESFCANTVWHRSGFKKRVSALAGFDATHPQLQTNEAYDTAYQTIYLALPNCRNCGCL